MGRFYQAKNQGRYIQVVNSDRQLKYTYWIVLLLSTITYLSGIDLPIMGVDASQYASISMEMLDTGSYLEVMHRGNDYLDKPPLLFWLSSFSFSIFGLENWAYRLPSILFIYLGIYSTLRLGKLLYSKATGYIAAMIFATTQAIFIISHDVRTDTILVGAAVFAVWGIVEFLENQKKKYLVLGFIGVGLAMLSKGPIGLMVPVLALSTHFLVRRQWRNFFRWEWLIGLVIVAIVISPMVYGLYTQYDAQPDKITKLSSGKTVEGISGLKFYFWEQSFGRITGESEWDNGAPWHFFLGIFSWSFLPWTFIAVLGIIHKFRSSFKAIKVSEFYTLGAIILPFAALSLSKFKLDHYIYIIYPFVAILAANYLVYLFSKEKGTLASWIQMPVIAILLTGVILIGKYVFPDVGIIYWIALGAMLLFIIALYLRRRSLAFVVLASAGAACIMNVFLKTHFFNSLANYDGQYTAAQITNDLGIPAEMQNVVQIPPHSYDFYTRSTTTFWSDFLPEQFNGLEGKSFLMPKSVFVDRNLKSANPKEYYRIDQHSPTMLNLEFLKESSRDSSLENVYLVIF